MRQIIKIAVLVFCWISTILQSHCKTEENVPFIAWSNQKYLQSLPSEPAGHIMNEEVLKSNVIQTILQNRDNDIVCVFRFNQLSIDDISKYTNSYSPDSNGGRLVNMKQSIDESISHLTLPMVEPVPLRDIEEIAGHTLLTYDKSNQWINSLTKDQVDVIVVPLQLSSDRGASLSEADDVIEKVLNEVTQLGLKYTVILTAGEPSKIAPPTDNEVVLQVGRHLLQSTSDNQNFSVAKFDEGGCKLLLFVEKISVSVGQTISELPYADDWNTTASECNNASSRSLVMSKKFDESTGNVTYFEMTLNFSQVKGGSMWNFNDSTAVIEWTDNKTLNFKIDASDTPVRYSYHCGRLTFTEGSGTGQITLTLSHFQVQPYYLNEFKFAQANECVGFVTPGIWMGLVTTLILVLILYFGVSMLASLTVMDQFDDPKGQTITVNVNE